jgi:prepilin-type processing-associated H-X9-DG protein
MIMVQWRIWQQDDPDKRDFDRQAATRDLLALWSPWTEQSKFQRRVHVGRAVEEIGGFAVLTAVYALLVIPLVRRRRWLVIGGLAVCLTLVYASFNAGEIAYALCPNSHAYLDDYVYVNDIDLAPRNGEPSTTIAAYDWRSFKGAQQRIVAFADGHVEEFSDDQAKPLFEANGLEYPVQVDADAGE